MIRTQMNRLFSAVSRCMDTLPEPLVIKAMQFPSPAQRTRA